MINGRGKKPSKPKTQNQSEVNIIKCIRNLFKLKREIKQLKIEYFEILGSFSNKKMIIMNQ